MEGCILAAVFTTPEVEKTIVGPSRVLSVDLLRGLTIAFMILVNDPGRLGPCV